MARKKMGRRKGAGAAKLEDLPPEVRRTITRLVSENRILKAERDELRERLDRAADGGATALDSPGAGKDDARHIVFVGHGEHDQNRLVNEGGRRCRANRDVVAVLPARALALVEETGEARYATDEEVERGLAGPVDDDDEDGEEP
jgi:regulator of replication initiation timing